MVTIDTTHDDALREVPFARETIYDGHILHVEKWRVPRPTRRHDASRSKSDPISSIHMNTNKSSSPSGVSGYVSGVEKSSKIMDGAMKENDVITYE